MDIRELITRRMTELELTPADMRRRIGGPRGKTVQNFLYEENGRCRSDVVETMLDDLGLTLIPVEELRAMKTAVAVVDANFEEADGLKEG